MSVSFSHLSFVQLVRDTVDPCLYFSFAAEMEHFYVFFVVLSFLALPYIPYSVREHVVPTLRTIYDYVLYHCEFSYILTDLFIIVDRD